MCGKWTLQARNLGDDKWQVLDLYLSFFGWLFKGLYCVCVYDIVKMEKHSSYS